MTARAPLLVIAHPQEARAFSDIPHLVTGIGKVSAAITLTRTLEQAEPGAINAVVVLGTAGLLNNDKDINTVYQVTSAVQHDFSLGSATLSTAANVIVPDTAMIATGDVFLKDDAQRRLLREKGADLVDMETWVYAEVCRRFDLPIQVFKVPSDYADSSTTDEEWDAIVLQRSHELRAFYEKHIR
ncbi:purine-nucleoside phosphorylase [Lysinibacter sp. HNR]|uniref:phosphorylase family protein n=1 Tax=Lysinibacter sp. HNR TaxID=3031408 RepID=UPI0024348214|nr:purine-nucleoside phosphorylase [Lysinibacter sp. HNR]WGD37417.1 purine-nucleoside phosphorylase [Lysinibacter sp. HNR]